MMKDLRQIVRDNILKLDPYSTARDDYKGGDIDVWLDANENPYDKDWNRYPDPHQKELKKRISQIKNVPADQIFIGNGSDEAIDLTYRIFCRPGIDNAIAISPSYGMYEVAADINDIELRKVTLNPDFSLPVDRILEATDENTKVIWICSPNNPTGNAFPREAIEQLLKEFDGIVVVDEAYADFSDKGSMLELLDKYPGLIVLQTLSKAWGMAGLRVGLAFAGKDIMKLFANVKYPYNVSAANQRAAMNLLKDFNEEVPEIQTQRDKLAKRLKTSKEIIEVYPSDANFLLVKVEDANEWYDRLLQAGIIVRNRSSMPLCNGCLRITIGTPEENERVAKEFGCVGTVPAPAKKKNLKQALFIDRDGTIIKEPEDEQVDSLEKMDYVPGAISGLKALSKLDYELVMATNQDGLGTDAFPTEDFLPPHSKILETLEGEGVTWDDILIDKTFPYENAPTRKPKTGMFGKYLDGSYDMQKCYVIGDRITDMQLAQNLGCKGLLLGNPNELSAAVKEAGLEDTVKLITESWDQIADYVRVGDRRAKVRRKTRETDIKVSIDLDNRCAEEWKIDTGLKFLDHMLEQIPNHGGVKLQVTAKGDLEVDEHHTIEDIGITLGEAISQALGNKAGIGRYGFALPMDDSRAIVLLDFGGRIDLEWDVEWTREYVGDVPTEMIRHFFQSLCSGAKCNMYVQARGENEHHKAEAIFKAFARAFRAAVARQKFDYSLPSSKGVL